MKKVVTGMSAHFSTVFDEAAMNAFRDLSGDRNPLHLDAAAAKKAGFDGPVVYGGLLIAAVSKLIGQELPGAGCVWHNVSMEFVAPLYVGEKIDVAGVVSYVNPELRVFQMKIEITRSGKPIARGKAQGNYPPNEIS